MKKNLHKATVNKPNILTIKYLSRAVRERGPSLKLMFGILFIILSQYLYADKDPAADTTLKKSKEIYTYLGPGPQGGYDRELIDLVLELTIDRYGDYELQFAPDMSEARARKMVSGRRYPNAIRSDVTDDHVINDSKLKYLPYPIYFGILGYRVCFVPKNQVEMMRNVKTFKALSGYVHGQASGWRDADILRQNGITVREAPETTNLYKMLNANRIDLFCRGINEVLNESEHYKGLENVDLDHSFALYYPLPIFYYVNSENTRLYSRVNEGLEMAFKNGSMKELWKKHFYESIEHAELRKRKIFYLENSYAKHIPFEYEHYIYRADAK